MKLLKISEEKRGFVQLGVRNKELGVKVRKKFLVQSSWFRVFMYLCASKSDCRRQEKFCVRKVGTAQSTVLLNRKVSLR